MTLKNVLVSKDDQGFVSLRAAPDAFGPRALVRKALAEERSRQLRVPTDLSEAMPERLFAGIAKLGKYFSPLPAVSGLRERVAEMLHAGDLEARGIQVSPEPGIGPEPVPSHMFSDPYKIDWTNSVIRKSGRKYEEIQVRRRKPNHPARRTFVPGEIIQKGRPTKDAEISQIIDDIFPDHGIANSIKRQGAYVLIRKEATRRKLNIEVGYSDPVLQKLLFRKFGARR